MRCLLVCKGNRNFVKGEKFIVGEDLRVISKGGCGYDCEKCGWNPVVAEQRMSDYLEKRGRK